ncbi:hypothetical protein A2865_00015 [Candidatus Woesebacteria bacterium RIFCSPHIGHO2_01_FULL_39_17]|uniref:KH domain-containing protein n=3 Tax=Candidatus Woeseibacteriota TaxID=1752722 RepID=A0A0G0NDM0_9BACT|nr:MAG: hypothetical protein US72_C0022G0014 [Microgenomates group bacterium GW2011_GWC1_38_12]KKQ93241.1 MAG: hypothetical protein UT19_C0015G0002 [Candidatus Woesebacteria bacterium GW2011_GWB1_39_10b]KKR14234.1 MAG: hypothetical protein UT40_C0004G0057 [Candidatus Woesebacteria bacterium GW2011_GWA1_39_21b]OGM23193.1 MAG: hypothetical protein A2865_00015 [Candidatus Woesebacteria bacterium RIFCSPHIGHO2_01_FULL_39_17]OGM61459.1 MAG: hypothetical protein A3A52_01425 [Candidatus Woesebacteria b
MKDLLTYILEGIIEKGSFEIEENEENSHVDFKILADPAICGLIIGKGGQTIKSIQTLLRVKGKLEGKSVFVNLEEKNSVKRNFSV